MALLLNAGDTVSRSYSYTQPSPLHPSQPQGTGERTANLFDPTAYYEIDSGVSNIVTTQNSITYNVSGAYRAIRYGFSLAQNETMKLSLGSATGRLEIRYYNTQTGRQVGDPLTMLQNERKTLTGSSEYDSVRIFLSNGATIGTMSFSNIMINIGTTFLPFEPYGYKIPISSGDVTTPVYLGEVQSTRLIRELVLTGEEEGWTQNTVVSLYTYINNSITTGYYRTNGYCSHLQVVSSTAATEGIYFGGAINLITPTSLGLDTVQKFKQYLADQYAAGTPVTVWYVLATPTTGIVNEPLMKIGDYADTVSNVSIPTTAGANSFDVLTTLKPSEVTVNYKGWHPVQSVHEKSKNLFDKSKRTNNSRVVYTTGEIGALNGVFVSDFTPIEPNATYTLNIVSSISSKTGHLYALYDENKDFVNTGSHEATPATVYTFTTPSNVAYIRFNGNMESADEIMFNTGSSALPYEPYWK